MGKEIEQSITGKKPKKHGVPKAKKQWSSKDKGSIVSNAANKQLGL